MTPTHPVRTTPRRADSALTISLALLIALLVGACGSGKPKIDPILQLSTQEALERGAEMMEAKKYNRAHRFYNHAFESSPNSREGRGALLLAADALFLAGGIDNFVLCEAKYRDFINRFPTSDRADYAQFQAANCLAARMEKPDRDQDTALKALDAYEELFRLYPTSGLLDEARQRAEAVRNQLARAEFLVGSFYVRYRLCRAAIGRLEPIPDTYPTYEGREEVLFHLGRAYVQCRNNEKAADVLDELNRDFPQSRYIGKLDKLLTASRKRLEKGS